MSLTRPVHEWESLDEADELVGRSWVVQAEHHGHTMRVVGRVVPHDDDDPLAPSSMLVVACSCGHEFRMADVTVDRALGVTS